MQPEFGHVQKNLISWDAETYSCKVAHERPRHTGSPRLEISPSLAAVEAFARQGYSLIPIATKLSSDVLTPVIAANKLRQLAQPFFLFESAEGSEQIGRYSIVGVKPFANLTCNDGTVTFSENGAITTHRTDAPMSYVAELLKKWQSPRHPDWPPFQGGAIGYISYDAVQYLERVPLPEVRSGSDDLRLMFFKSILVFDRLKHEVYLINHIEVGSDDLASLYRKASDEILDLKSQIFSTGTPAALTLKFASTALPLKPVSGNIGRDAYMKSVQTIKKHIREGDIFQCVLSDSFDIDIAVDPFAIYRVLRMINPSPYLFYINFGKETLLGSSPEMLTRVSDGLVETCPIAGTRPRGQNPAEDKKRERELLASIKEQAEHLMLVDLGRNDIGRIASIGSVRVKNFMQVERFSHVMHLVSLVEGRLKRGLTAWDALCSCFPAGTLTGAPKIRAMQIISEHEKRRRGTYGGAIIAHDYAGNLNSCITIRSLWVKEQKARIQAGAGIVADSRADKEYEEVMNKAKSMRTAIQLAETAEGLA